MAITRIIDKQTAQRLAVASQFLDDTPRPMLDTIRQLGCLQIDPLKTVIQTQYLVLWSRLGAYDIAEFEKLMWEDRALFEYWAHAASLVLTENYPIHRQQMARHADREKSREWVQENDALRRYVLETFKERGALPLKALEGNEHVTLDWHSTGWTNGRNIDRMVDYLWSAGELMVAGRQKGGFRVWDLASRVLPDWTPQEEISEEERVQRSLKIALKALGVATSKHITYHFTRYEYPNMTQHLKALEQAGEIERVQIVDKSQSLKGEWYVHNLALLDRIESGDWEPRATLLSPFDNLLCDRPRTEQLFDFSYRIEVYVPKEKRQYGYYVLPFLEGDRLVGRIDPAYDRKSQTLFINAIHWERPPTPAQTTALNDNIEALATWLGATRIRVSP